MLFRSTEAAKAKINSGAMTGTIKQDAEGMADAIASAVKNFRDGKDALYGFDESIVVEGWRVNVPYSAYTGDEE